MAQRRVHLLDGSVVDEERGGMSTLELVRLALSRLRRGRVRAALTMLGVIIGVASVVGLVSVGRGTTARITDQLNSLGTNLLTISPTGGGVDLDAHPRRRDRHRGAAPGSRAWRPRSRRQAVGRDEHHQHDDHVDRRDLSGLPVRARLRNLAGHVPYVGLGRRTGSDRRSSARRWRPTSASVPRRSARRSRSAACRSR